MFWPFYSFWDKDATVYGKNYFGSKKRRSRIAGQEYVSWETHQVRPHINRTLWFLIIYQLIIDLVFFIYIHILKSECISRKIMNKIALCIFWILYWWLKKTWWHTEITILKDLYLTQLHLFTIRRRGVQPRAGEESQWKR